MIQTPHLNPLASREGRGGSEPAAKAVGAAWFVNRAINAVIFFGVLAVAARLILINQPYVDHWSWRQSDVAAIARNFFENGFHFTYPQIDWAGDSNGYVGTEFPILPFVAAVCYKFGGVHEWIGRSQSLIFFAVSLPFFFLLVREIFGGTAAVWATFFYSFAPLNIFAGRSFMPDVPSLSLAIIGLYFFLRWTRDREFVCWSIAAMMISPSILIKVTTIVIFAPLAYLAVAGGADLGTKGGEPTRVSRGHRPRLQLLAFAVIAILPSVMWYWHAYQIAERFYPHHLFGAGGVRIESLSWYLGIARQTATSSLTPVLVIMAVIGLFVAPRVKPARNATASQARYSLLFHWWLVAMILFIVVVGYGNRHRWYQLPMVPIMAAFAGVGCAFLGSKISSRIVATSLSILLAGSFAILSYLYVRPLYEASADQLRNAGMELNKTAEPAALIVAADTGDPTIFYYAHRKGWHFLETDAIYAGNPSDSQQAIANLDELRLRGVTHVVFTVNTFWWLDYYPEFAQHLRENATLMEATSEFKIYRLTPDTR